MVKRIIEKRSLSQVYKGIFLIMIPVLMIGSIAAFSLGRNIQMQTLQVLRGDMDSQVNKLMQTFNNINYGLMSNLNSNENLQTMIDAEDILTRYKAINDLKSDFIELRYYFGSDYNFFACDSIKPNIYALAPDNIDYATYAKIKSTISTYLVSRTENEFITANRKWNLINSENGVPILLKIYENQGKTIGCWVMLDTIEQLFRVNEYSDQNNFMFLVKDGQVLTDEALFNKISGGESVRTYISKSGQKLKGNDVFYYDFYKGSFSILNISDTMGNYIENLKILYVFILLLSIVIGVGIFLLYYIKKRLIRPINVFMERLLKPEELSIDTRELGFTEFKEADLLFQKAKQQIKELKIAVYEKELQKQKLKEDYLQVQIKPHFYLNCLNIIYNLAQSKRYEEIQKLSMEVSNYMRTLFRSGMKLVLVKEEMEHLKGYLNIQEFRYSSSFTYKIYVEDQVRELRILPLIIHTLVENSIKHTIMKRNVVHIDISVTQQFEGEQAYIKIVVWDTGDGFNKDILFALQSGQELTSKEGQRIGLSNLVQRLEYVYKKQAHIHFCNREIGGAKVEILLPIGLLMEEIE